MNSTTTEPVIDSFDDLRKFVHDRLSQKESLLEDHFPMASMRLRKEGKDCGMQFLLQGPRNVRLSAIWVQDRNVVYFYDTRGERFDKLQLTKRFALNSAESSPTDA